MLSKERYIDKSMLSETLQRQVDREKMHKELLVFCVFLFTLLGFRSA